MKKYVVSEKELQELIKDSLELNALERGGVDNWEWYGEALDDFDRDEVGEDLSSYEIYS